MKRRFGGYDVHVKQGGIYVNIGKEAGLDFRRHVDPIFLATLVTLSGH